MNKKLTRISYKLLSTSFLFAAFALSALAASEEKLSRQIEARPDGKLIVDVDFGKVDVSVDTDDKVTIEAYRSVDFGDEAKEKEYLAEVPITISAEGNAVTVRARSSKNARHHSWHHSTMDGQYTLRVPKSFRAEVNTGGGRITARGLAGDLRAESGGGELKFSHLQGALKAETGGGSIDLDNCNGATEIETGGGDILLENGQGILRARTGGGGIDVRNFTGDADVQTGGGELSLEKIAGRIMGETGGGSITASVSGNVVNEISLESSEGSIDLALPATAAMDINAEASSGRIKTNLPLDQPQVSDEHLRGKLNGGGKRVVLRTSSGSITIRSSAETAAR